MSPRIGLLAVLAAVALVACGGGDGELRTPEGNVVGLPGKWPEQEERLLYEDLSAGDFLLPPFALCMMEELQGRVTLEQYRRFEADSAEGANPMFGALYSEAFANCLWIQGHLAGGA